MGNLVPASWRDSVEELRDRVSSIFDRWLPRRAEQVPTEVYDHWPGYLLSATAPTVDIEETDDEVIVTAEMPGLDEKDFNVELIDQRLILRGEKKASREEKKRNYYHAESSYGSFYRAVSLPCEVNGDNVRATYKRGILEVHMPKTEETKARTVRVKVK